MIMADIMHFPLAETWFCTACDTLTNCSDACPSCTGSELVPLSLWLDREPDMPKQPLPSSLTRWMDEL